MIASLDTNAIIHFYKAGKQDILFDFFDEGVLLYEQIRDIELENHGQEVLKTVDADINAGRILKYTDEELRKLDVYSIFMNHVNENKLLYSPKDLGEVYAISLAQTLGAYSLVTDDIKQGGPYMSLLQFDNDVMPFTFADVLILRFLMGTTDAENTVEAFNLINNLSELNWSFKSQIKKFIRRFFNDPYRKGDCEWIRSIIEKYNIKVKCKLEELSSYL